MRPQVCRASDSGLPRTPRGNACIESRLGDFVCAHIVEVALKNRSVDHFRVEH